MKIICIAGLMGSGKDSAAVHISRKYGYHIIDYAGKLRQICKNEGLGVTRENLQNLRIKYGNTFLAEAVVEEIKSSGHGKILLTPMRRSEDFLIPKNAFPSAKIKLILIEAPDTVRFERLAARKRENDPKTLEEFRQQEKREFEIFNFRETFSHADYTVTNDGSMESLKNRLDEIMTQV